MKLVVDTSVLIAVVAGEASRNRLIELTTGAELVAPASVHWEVGNALAAMVRRRRITIQQALRAAAGYGTISLRLIDVPLEEALSIAAEFGLYAYDAYVVVCALGQRASLLTLDDQLAAAARRAGVQVPEVQS
jgi:predicted nucleic acid-binding protein